MNIFGGKEAREAKDLTAEIDRAADAAVLAEGTAETDATKANAAEAGTAEAGTTEAGQVDHLAQKARSEAAKTEVHEVAQAGWQAGEVSAETRALGGAALEQAVMQSNEAVKEQVAAENGYVDTGLEAGANVIGGESEKQIKERLADDLADAQMETGMDLPPELQGEAAILSKNQENLTKEAMNGIRQVINRGAGHPAKLERDVHLLRVKMLKTFGRTLGERN